MVAEGNVLETDMNEEEDDDDEDLGVGLMEGPWSDRVMLTEDETQCLINVALYCAGQGMPLLRGQARLYVQEFVKYFILFCYPMKYYLKEKISL